MKKIPTIFNRDFVNNPKYVTKEENPEAQWVYSGEGTTTRKYDGTCCAIIDGIFYKRFEVKKGKPVPDGFVPATEVDSNTGKQQGWIEVGNGNEDVWHREAYQALTDKSDGTFELVGPKVQGNPDGFNTHTLVRHSDAEVYENVPRTYDGIKEFLKDKNIEGLVFHHPDGRMAKIKRRDFSY